MSDLTIGFTGTQIGMTASQCALVEDYLRRAYEYAKKNGLRPVFRHGDCVGSDDQAARIASQLRFYVVSHPCSIESKRAYSAANEVRQPREPLNRNKEIVNRSDYMLATPKEEAPYPEPLRSGTWATIRYARKMKKHITIFYA